MITNNDIDICKRVMKKAQDISNKWSRLVGYWCANNVNIDFMRGTISFRASPSSSGLGKNYSIPIKYLKDDSSLEKDGKKQYNDQINKEKKEINRLNFLESTSKVKEYKDLIRQRQTPFDLEII